MSTEKSFLDDNGLQRLWQKVTATVTNSISAAINALPSWAKSETKPSYTVSEISDAVSDEDFVAHTNDMTLHLSTDDRQDFSEITRYHKEYYNLPTPASSDKKYSFTSFDFGYVGTEIEGVAIDQTGKIYYCPNEVGNWYEYGNQLPDGAIGGFSYSIAIYNMQLYVAVMKNSDQCIWKLGDEGWTKIISYSSGSNHQIQVYGMFVVGDYLYGFGSDTYLLRISSDNTYEFIEIPNAYTDPNGDGSTSIHKAKATDDHTRAVLFDTINHTVYKLDGTTFSTPITYSSSITVTDIAPIYSQFGFFCVVLDYTDDIIYAVTSSGFMVESSGQMAFISGTPGIGVYQSSQGTNPIIVLIGGINGYYQENFPSRGGWKNLTIGGTPNSLDTVVCVHYATYSNKWFAIDENGKCIICSDLTSKWKNYRADVMDKSNNFISDEFRETIGAMDETGVAKLINEASAGLVKYDVAQSLTNAQKTQARSNIGAVGSDDITSLDPRGPWKLGGKLTKVTDSIVFYTPADAASAKQFSGVVNEFIFKINSITRKSGYEDYSVGIAPYFEVNFNRNGTESSFIMQVKLSDNLTSDDEIDAFVGSFFHFGKRYVTSTYAVYEPSINDTNGTILSPVVMQESMLKNYIVNMTFGLGLANNINQRVDSVDIDFWYR